MNATATATQAFRKKSSHPGALIPWERNRIDREQNTGLLKGQDIFEAARISKTIRKVLPNDIIFSQGDPCRDVIYIQEGEIKLSVVSSSGKEAIVAILRSGDFFGEGALMGQAARRKTAAAIASGTIFLIDRKEMMQALHAEQAFSDFFLKFMLERNNRIETDLIDQLFNCSEKRLARILLLLAGHGRLDQSEWAPLKISQETLAGMVGTTRGRVNLFINKFKRLGFIQYNRGLRVNGSLLRVVLQD